MERPVPEIMRRTKLSKASVYAATPNVGHSKPDFGISEQVRFRYHPRRVSKIGVGVIVV